MILPFKQLFPWGGPTCFMEKIGASKPHTDFLPREKNPKFDIYKIPIVDVTRSFKPKRHSIRALSKRKWREGSLIHCYYNNRSKDAFQFHPTFMCTGIQNIKIRTFNGGLIFHIYVDGWLLNYNKMEALAINDGFDSLEDFLKWFNKDFDGIIIHWTDLKY